mgnify:CR=1 FL=1
MDTFLILSGGKIFSTSKYSNDHIADIKNNLSGTTVLMSLSNFTQKSDSDVLTFNYSSIIADTSIDYLPICNDKIVEATSNEIHHYKFVYFVDVDMENLLPFNFIYKINLIQVQ